MKVISYSLETPQEREYIYYLYKVYILFSIDILHLKSKIFAESKINREQETNLRPFCSVHQLT